MSEKILKIINLCSRDSDGYSVKDINLELKKGEIHVLIGENGSGKSTFFEAISGQRPDSTGQIIFYEKSTFLTPSFKGIDGISYIQRHPYLVDNISITENLFLFLYKKRRMFSLLNWKKMNEEVREILNNYGINSDPRRKVFQLTQEERKVLELAKFQIEDNLVAIFLEPTDELGFNTIKKFYQLLSYYKSQGKSFLIITRNWEEALKIADRITVMAEGKIIGTMTAAAARENPGELFDMLLAKSRYKKENNKVITTIFKATELLTSEYELNDLLSFIARQAAEIMSAQKCTLELVDEKTGTVIEEVTYGLDNTIIGRLERDKLIEYFSDHNDILCISRDDESFQNFVAEAGNIRAVICLPILTRSRIAGFIQVFYSDYYQYTDDELIYLSTLAKQAAIAIEDTRLMGRSALLMESHHRIKNNLQSIISLINIQKNFIDKGEQKDIKDVLDKIIARITSIAFVHDILSKDEQGRSILNIKQLINIIADFYNIDSRIKLELDIDNIFISYNKATSIALIINELINNCFDHAFPEDSNGLIKIKCKKQNEKILLEVTDDGIGIPEDFDLDRLDSLGLSIVRAIITNEFKGRMIIRRKKGLFGTQVLVRLPINRCLI